MYKAIVKNYLKKMLIRYCYILTCTKNETIFLHVDRYFFLSFFLFLLKVPVSQGKDI